MIRIGILAMVKSQMVKGAVSYTHLDVYKRQEYSNAYIYSREYAERMMPEWTEAVLRDYNHPCIVAWVPLNESWGVDGIMYNREEQAHSQAMYYLTKSLDQTRLVISNDGWNHTVSDLLTIHDYEGKKETLLRRYPVSYTHLDVYKRQGPDIKGSEYKQFIYCRFRAKDCVPQ